jgi:isopenicillin N synthase-like dioxygenase
METTTLPVVDISPFLTNPSSPEAQAACKTVVDTLKKTSCLIIKTPKVREEDNSAFLDLVESYFSQRREDLMKDVHPELSYQVGATPEFTEVPRDHTDVITKLQGPNAAHKPAGPDPKWRFFWRIGERPSSTEFPEMNAPPVIPEHFQAQWSQVMDRWGNLMLSSVSTVAEMIATGVGLPVNAFTDLMHNGPHLLAPTGSDLTRFGNLDTVFAGFHYDFNLLTIHGKSRFPGLFIWLRDGTRYQVKVPDGCLLLQAGKQMEWLTGGEITAGFHEVVVCDDTLKAVERAKDKGASLWRISSTLFSHVASDKTLVPLPPFATPEALVKYPATLAGKQSEEELQAIALQATVKA